MSKSRKSRPVGQGRWDGTVTLSEALQIAAALHRKGETAEAETLYNRVLAAQPDQPDALHFLGVLHHQRGQSAEAADLIARSLANCPDQPGTLTNLGNIPVKQGQVAEAAEAYRKAIALEPGHAGAHGRGYVQSLLDEIGLVTLEIESAVLRQENLKPVDGIVVSAHRDQVSRVPVG